MHLLSIQLNLVLLLRNFRQITKLPKKFKPYSPCRGTGIANTDDQVDSLNLLIMQEIIKQTKTNLEWYSNENPCKAGEEPLSENTATSAVLYLMPMKMKKRSLNLPKSLHLPYLKNLDLVKLHQEFTFQKIHF